MLKHVQQHGGVIISREIKVMALEICFQNVLFLNADFAKFFRMDYRIQHHPSANIWLNRRRTDKLEELCLLHADLDEVYRRGASGRFDAQQMIGKPVAQQADGVTDAL